MSGVEETDELGLRKEYRFVRNQITIFHEERLPLCRDLNLGESPLDE